MTFKRKVAATTIAVSLTMSAFAGIPLSTEGLMAKFVSSQVASAAGDFPHAQFKADLKELYDALGTDGVNKVKALQNKTKSLEADSKWSDILDPITSKFSLSASEKTQFESFLLDLITIDYNPSSDYGITKLEELRLPNKDLLQDIADRANNSVGTLELDDFVKLFQTFQSDVFSKLDTLSFSELNGVLDNYFNNNPKFEKMFAPEGYNVSNQEIVDALFTFTMEAGLSTVKDAAAALNKAYNKIKNPETGNPGTGGGFPVLPSELPAPVQNLLDNLEKALEKATDEEKQKLVDSFIADAAKEAAKLAAIDAKNAIKTEDGQASISLDEKELLKAIAGIKALEEKVNELDADATILPTLTIQTGEIAEDSIVYNIQDAVIKAAAAANLPNLVLESGKFAVEIPLQGTFTAGIRLEVNKLDVDAESVSDLKAASQLYELNLYVGEKKVETFSHPLIVSIPLGDITGLDKELLSLAKLNGDRLEFFGGRVKGDIIVAARDSFSKYVVLENKVSFNDIASVQEWAGRAIEVVAAKGAIVGKQEGVFAPRDSVTRAEFAKMLVHAMNLLDQSATESFNDVNDSDWFKPYVASAVKLGIINGRSADRFDPKATITRAEMATMIARALKVTEKMEDVKDQDAVLSVFKDAAAIQSSLKAGVSFAVEHGIVVGFDGKFAPNDKSTRAQAAVMIHRTLNVN
ncbi:S-layer homology domain-containing protein [Paenibacillus sp. GXUN7292]|uniref:S-layer homology domain-containing protein n=1 Tax=Paenibacillus sp. GXUN7292 TaxID=3422499 RepID=UPI003D7D9BD7